MAREHLSKSAGYPIQTSPCCPYSKFIFTCICLHLLINPISTFSVVSLENLQVAEHLKFFAEEYRKLADTLIDNGNPRTQSTGEEGNGTEVDIVKRYQAFAYPYAIYEVSGLSFLDILDFLKPHNQKETGNSSAFIFNMSLTGSRKGSQQGNETKNSNPHRRQLYLLEKISTCASSNACRLLEQLPDNMALAADEDTEHLNLLVTSESSFVVESMRRKRTSPEGGYGQAEIWLFTLNLNRYIFLKLNQQVETFNYDFDRLLARHRVFDIKEGEESQWDVAYNGSSHRFVKVRRQAVREQEQSRIGPAKGGWGLQAKLQERRGLCLNILEMVEHSINMYQENRHYFTKFYTAEVVGEPVGGGRMSRRKGMVGVGKERDFFLFLTHRQSSSQYMTRVLKATLDRLELIEQIVSQNGSTSMLGMGEYRSEVVFAPEQQDSDGNFTLPPDSDGSWNQSLGLAVDNVTGMTIDLDQLAGVEGSTFFPFDIYQDREKFRFESGSKLMETKLRPMLAHLWHESPSQQQANCELTFKEGSTADQATKELAGIHFGKRGLLVEDSRRVWSICRLSINIGHQSVVIEPEESSLASHNGSLVHPYTIYRCTLYSTSISRCYYHEWEADKRALLPQNSKSILFIVNRGQTYDLRLSDLNSIEMDKIAESFLIMFLSLATVTCIFSCIIICRPLCTMACISLGWTNARPHFTYPLNCLELRFKLRRMRTDRLIKPVTYRRQNESMAEGEEDDCVFCLQPKEPHSQILEVYCRHSYHQDCFEAWVRQESGQLQCPMCKRRISVDGLSQYQGGSQIQQMN